VSARAARSRVAAPIAVALALAASAPRSVSAVAIARGSVLASYSFDDDVATGPDTFAVWQGARHNKGGRGRVRLSESFHLSGHRAVELKDVPGDGDFPELQGYFPVQGAGRLYFHFAFLTTDPSQELNIALAGPRFFQMEKDGIAFWLGTRDGRLVQYSDSIPKRLFVPQAFTWYVVDVAYDVSAGRYDLLIRAEGDAAPLVSLRSQPNTTSRPGSAVDKFSFVGSPFADRSSVVYYVDDVVIGTDDSVTRLPFTAPGRRKLFIDRFGEYQRLLRERPRCLPALGPEDFGLEADDLEALAGAGQSDALQRLLEGPPGTPGPRVSSEQGPERWRRALTAAAGWSDGCAALERGDAGRRSPASPPRPRRCPKAGSIRCRPRWRSPRRSASTRRTISSRSPRTFATTRATPWPPPTSGSPARTSSARSSGCGSPRPGRSTATRSLAAAVVPSRPSSPSSTTTCCSGRRTTTARATTRCGWPSAPGARGS
jgi:hypothetical protein